MPPFPVIVGSAIQRFSDESSHVTRADGAQVFDVLVAPETAIAVLWSEPPSEAASNRKIRPFDDAAATISLPPLVKITGEVENTAPGMVNQSFTARVAGSSATTASE